MADHDSFFHYTVISDLKISHLTVHLIYCRTGGLKIIRSLTVFICKSVIEILEVRQINIYLSLKRAQRLHTVISVGVINNWNRKFFLKTAAHSCNIVAGSNKVYVMRPLPDKLMIDLPETSY